MMDDILGKIEEREISTINSSGNHISPEYLILDSFSAAELREVMGLTIEDTLETWQGLKIAVMDCTNEVIELR